MTAGQTHWYDEKVEMFARAYERAQSRLFVFRMVLLFILSACFWRTGASRALLAGLDNAFHFPFAWVLECALFSAFAAFGFEVFLFPLAVFSDYELERRYKKGADEFGSWLWGYFSTLLIEMAIVAAGYTSLYVLMWFTPTFWWLLASLIYGLLVMGLMEHSSSWVIPQIHETTEIHDPVLAEELSKLAAHLHISSCSFRRWVSSEDYDWEDLMLVKNPSGGIQLVFSPRALQSFSRDELLFLSARVLFRYRRKAVQSLFMLRLLLTTVVFAFTALGMKWLAPRIGLSAVFDLAGFPFLTVFLFALSTCMAPILNGYSRRMELQADEFAAQYIQDAAVIDGLLQKAFRREAFGISAAWWEILLLRDVPTTQSRLHHINEALQKAKYQKDGEISARHLQD